MTRSAARLGDVVAVSGSLGDSAAGPRPPRPGPPLSAEAGAPPRPPPPRPRGSAPDGEGGGRPVRRAARRRRRRDWARDPAGAGRLGPLRGPMSGRGSCWSTRALVIVRGQPVEPRSVVKLIVLRQAQDERPPRSEDN